MCDHSRLMTVCPRPIWAPGLSREEAIERDLLVSVAEWSEGRRTRLPVPMSTTITAPLWDTITQSGDDAIGDRQIHGLLTRAAWANRRLPSPQTNRSTPDPVAIDFGMSFPTRTSEAPWRVVRLVRSYANRDDLLLTIGFPAEFPHLRPH